MKGRLKPDIIKENNTRISFTDADEKTYSFVVEKNTGQSLFDDKPDAFIALDSDGWEGWNLTKADAKRLSEWLKKVLA